ncbi:MAG: serine/threonine protein kinase [Myxococcales bacterium]|nr:serine/threonine protein kinase [Myxococcales bacterium]
MRGDAPRPTALAATTPASNVTLVSRPDDTIVPPSLLPDPSEEKQARGERYEIGGVLGAGGMGEVRTTRDKWIGREVAMKTLLDTVGSRAGARGRFLREIRVQGQLEHPSIVPVYDFGVSTDGELYFTMRRVRGSTLASVIHGLGAGDAELEARFSRRKLLTAFSAICMTVHYAHSRGVIHRDLKPGNVMFGDFGEVYVLDWGIAKIVDVAAGAEEVETGEESTGAGRIIGTLGYMSPEQAAGGKVDARTDVYSLGVILYEILTRESLLQETNVMKALDMIAAGLDARPSRRAPGVDIPPELDAICLQATARDPDARFETAKDLSEAVERFLDGDRDLERRRELASEMSAKSGELYAQAMVKGADPEEAHAARLESFRGVIRALALDPSNEGAQSTLGHLLLDPPKEMPSAARAERDRLRAEERAAGAGLGLKGFLSYLLAFPLMVLAGVRSATFVLSGLVATLVAAALARYVQKTKRASSGVFYTLLAVCIAIVALQSTWLGPFVLTPTAAALTLSVFALYAERRERALVLLAGTAMIAIPFLAELVPGVPHAFSFEAGEIVLHPRALELPVVVTVIGLVYTALGFALLPAIFLFRLRDTLRVAEERRFLQAWTLHELFRARA